MTTILINILLLKISFNILQRGLDYDMNKIS